MIPWWRLADPGPVDGGQGRDLARRELSKPMYHRDDPSALDRFLQRVRDWLDNLHHTADGPGKVTGTGGGGGWGALIIILLVLVVIVVLVLLYMRRHANLKSRKALLDDEPTTAAGHRSAAERFAAAGQWAEAIRERLRGIARDLEERAILDGRPGRTADELAAEAGPALPAVADELAAGVRVFDDVWYGDRPGTVEGYDMMTALETRVRATRPRPLGDQADAGAEPAGSRW